MVSQREQSTEIIPPYSFIQNWNDLEEPKLYVNRHTFKNVMVENLLNEL